MSVQADRRRLEQGLDSLLDNAVRYSPAGETVEVEVSAEADRAVVTVTDHGIGIPATSRLESSSAFIGPTTTPRTTKEGVEEEGSTFHFSLPPGEIDGIVSA